MSVFRVLEVSPGVSGFVPRLLAPLIGRDTELRLLDDAFRDSVGAGACRMALVLGEPGIGKSRLVRDFAASVADEALLLWGRCPSYGDGLTFFPIVEVIRAAAQIAEDDSAEVAREKLRAVVDGQSAGSLAEILQLPGALARPRQSFRAVGRLLESLAEDRPLLIVLDDLHWAASMLLDLVEHVATRSRGPILLVCMARPELDETRPTWRSAIANTRVELAPLDASAANDLVAALLGGAVSEDVPSSIVETADGNPLYVEELVAMLIDRRILARGADGWVRTAALPDTAVPPTLQALLQARLELLPVLERTVVEVGSIEGKSFHTGTVLALAGEELGAEDLGSALDALLGRDFVRPDRPIFADEHAFRFRHQLIRDAAYARVPKARRATLHERLADRLEREGHRVPEPDALLGYHLEQAYRLRAELGNTGVELEALGARAAAKLAGAGRLAGDRGDDVAAVNLLERAAALAPPDDRERAEIVLDLCEVLPFHAVAKSEGFASQALAIARGLNDRALEMRAGLMVDGGRGAPRSSSIDDMIREFERAIPILEEAGDGRGLARALRDLGLTLEARCHYAAEEAVLLRAVELSSTLGLPREESTCLLFLSGVYVLGPTPVPEALRRCEEIVERGEHSPLVECGVTWRMGYLEAMAGRRDRAYRSFERAGAFAEEHGIETQQSNMLHFRGEMERLLGDLEAAERWDRFTLDVAARGGDRVGVRWAEGRLARLLVEAGRHEEAYPLTVSVERNCLPDDIEEGVCWRTSRAAILAARGDGAGAETVAREAVVLAADGESLEVQGNALSALGAVLLAVGRSDEAAVTLRDAIERYERKGIVRSAAKARAMLEALD